MNIKKNINDLALFGGRPVFSTIRSTSNLVKPDIERFLFYAKKSFDSGWLTNDGPMVHELEKRLSDLHQTRYCVTFCSGFWGLVLCMKHLALQGKKEVIMPSMTYRRLADLAAWVKLTPNFCDIDSKTLGACVATVEACITSETALILIAHPIVNICDVDGLTGLAAKHGIPILFDSVEAPYSSYKGKMIGSFGQAECFSVHASKLLNGFEGGYMTTNDLELAENTKKMRAFGFSGQDKVDMTGINAKLNEIHAAMTLASIDGLEEQVVRNRRRYHNYRELLEPIAGLEIVKYDENEKRGFKNILLKINDEWPVSRKDTLDILHAENMLARAYYSPPLHMKKTDYKTIKGELPVTELLAEKYLLMPCGEFVSTDDIQAITSILGFIQESGEQLKKYLEQMRK